MTAGQLDVLYASLDEALAAVRQAIRIAAETQAGPYDPDLYGCALNEIESALNIADIALTAIGAEA